MNWDVKFTDFQLSFLNSKDRFPAFVAAWATGKTMTALAKGVVLSATYPNNLGLVLRKNFTDLKDSTMADFELYTGMKVKAQSKSVTFPNGSKILFHHADELAGVIQNINLGWFFIEQAEEFDNDEVFEKLDGRLRRKGCFCQGFIIANTNGHNWIWRKWKNKGGAEYFCDIPFDITDEGERYTGYASLVEARTHDNLMNLKPSFLASLKIKEKTSPSHYRRFVLNSWEEVDVHDEVLPYRLILDAVKKELLHFVTPARVVSCDPAEMGDDHTVIYAFEGGKVIDCEITSKKEPMDTAGRILRMYKKHNATLAVIDADGYGSPIVSRLGELDVSALGVKSGKSSDFKDDFRNIKAEMWMNAKSMFSDGLVSIPDDQKLIEDLAAHSYTLNSKGQIMIVKKDDVKKKLGRSPDQGDALVLGLWGVKKVGVPQLVDYEEEDLNTANSYTIKTAF